MASACDSRPITLRNDSQLNPSFYSFSFVLTVYCWTTAPFFLILFIYLRTRYQYVFLIKRNLFAIIVCTIGMVSITLVGTFRDIYGREIFPCELALWGRIIGCVGLGLPIVFSLSAFRDQLRWAKALQAISFHKLQEVIDEQAMLIESQTKRKSIFRPAVNRISNSHLNGVHRAPSSGTNSDLKSSSSVGDDKASDFNTVFRQQNLGRKILLFSYPFVPPLILGLAFQFSRPFYGNGCVGCYDETLFLGVLGAILATLALSALWNGYYLRNAADPLHMLSDLKWGTGLAVIFGGIPLFLLIIDQEIGAFYDRGIVSWDWFINLAMICYHSFMCPVPIFYALRQSRFSSTRVRYELKELLANQSFQTIFSSYLVSEFSIENLKFWNQVETYRNRHSAFRDNKEANLAAIQTYNTFIKPNSVLEVNIPAKMRDDLEAEFSKYEIGDAKFGTELISPTVFDTAQEEILVLMNRDSFKRFQESKEFKNFCEHNLVLDSSKGTYVVASAL